MKQEVVHVLIQFMRRDKYIMRQCSKDDLENYCNGYRESQAFFGYWLLYTSRWGLKAAAKR